MYNNNSYSYATVDLIAIVNNGPESRIYIARSIPIVWHMTIPRHFAGIYVYRTHGNKLYTTLQAMCV